MRSFTLIIGAALVISSSGCTIGIDLNPAFPIHENEAREFLRQHAQVPIRLKRPVVVLAGYQDPGFVVHGLARRLRRVVHDPGQVIGITFFTDGTFDGCRARVVEQVESAFPTDDPQFTREVDVIGISMGGIVARHAARDLSDGSRRLRIHTLYTIASPHQGAKLATLPTFDQRQIDMRPGSEFLQELNDDPTSQDFEIVAYAYLDDEVVGVRRTAPPGQVPWWLPEQPLRLAHMSTTGDSRILADIVQRLQGRPPFTVGSPLWPEDIEEKDADESDAQE